MSNYYNLDGIKTELKKNIAKDKAFLKEWEKVTFPTKKDGTPFAVMSKNINGAKYQSILYSMQPGENELAIVVFCKEMGNGYIQDSIDVYELVKYLKDEKKIEKHNNYMPKVSYLEQVYKYDIEDIKEAVTNRINYLKDRILSLTSQLDNVDYCYNEFKKSYSKALKELENNCIIAGNVGFSEKRNDMYYMILDTVKESYPYC